MNRFIKHMHFPKLPAELEEHVRNFVLQQTPRPSTYSWFHADEVISDWCSKNICEARGWGIQVMRHNLEPHCDRFSKTKINYWIDLGGDNVITSWVDPLDNDVIIESIVCDAKTWYILDVGRTHKVSGLTGHRIGISGMIFT